MCRQLFPWNFCLKTGNFCLKSGNICPTVKYAQIDSGYCTYQVDYMQCRFSSLHTIIRPKNEIPFKLEFFEIAYYNPDQEDYIEIAYYNPDQEDYLEIAYHKPDQEDYLEIAYY